MVLAVDFDDTLTLDPVTVKKAILIFLNAGWQVIIATGRNHSPGNDIEVGLLLGNLAQHVPVVWCSGMTKRQATERAGYKVKLWLDDCPAMIDGNLPILGQGPQEK